MTARPATGKPAPLSSLAQCALSLLLEAPAYVPDARAGAPLDNSVVGSLLAITYQQPRQYTEAAVRDALEALDRWTAEGDA